ncbi:hypothetical protein AALA61_15755 [Oscillospiraceae bacterium 42-9]
MLANTYVFTQKSILIDKLLDAFRNQFRVVSSRSYSDKKGLLPDGYTYTLLVLHDDFDYGIDKQGKKRDSNQYQTFDVTVLSREHAAKKGDTVQLVDFDREHSYAIGFDLLLRFKDIKILPPQGGNRPHA